MWRVHSTSNKDKLTYQTKNWMDASPFSNRYKIDIDYKIIIYHPYFRSNPPAQNLGRQIF